jgi:hypothetical protein
LSGLKEVELERWLKKEMASADVAPARQKDWRRELGGGGEGRERREVEVEMAEEREGEENTFGEVLGACGYGFGFEALGLSFDLDFVVKTWGIGEGGGEEADLRRDRGNLEARMEGGSFPIFMLSTLN